jgi:hypothetical protein
VCGCLVVVKTVVPPAAPDGFEQIVQVASTSASLPPNTIPMCFRILGGLQRVQSVIDARHSFSSMHDLGRMKEVVSNAALRSSLAASF